LPIVNWRDVRAGVRRQQRERLPCPVWHRPPQACEAKPVLACPGEFPFRLRGFCSGELEEVRCRNETASFRKAPPLGAEIDDRRSLRPRRRKFGQQSLVTAVAALVGPSSVMPSNRVATVCWPGSKRSGRVCA
jgi:hypothetical protein